MDIGEWLRGLGLQSYEQTFRDNRIDLEVLSRLTVDDLKEIGVQAVGHRRKILDAIGLLPADPGAARTPISAERRQLIGCHGGDLAISCEKLFRPRKGMDDEPG